MRVAHRDCGLVVIDDVLATPAFHAIVREIAAGEYHAVHGARWDKAWRLWDGQPLRGDAVYFDPGGTIADAAAVYPTASSVDAVIEAIRRASAECPEVAGVEGVDWSALSVVPVIYPVGAARAQHQDTERSSGTFTFFAHARWNTHWGGELLVWPPRHDDGGGGGDPAAVGAEAPWMTEDGADPIGDAGVAACVLPRPNRLVLIAPDRPYRIARVDPNAGAHVRASLDGLFLRAP